MAYTNSSQLGVDISAVSAATPDYAVGGKINLTDCGEHIYVKAAAAIVAGDVLQVTMSSGSATGLTTALADAATTTAGQLIAVANVSITSGQYGWACLRGVPLAGISVLASCVRGSALYTTTTAGALDDTATHLVAGIETTVTATGAAATAGVCSNPVLVSGTVANS